MADDDISTARQIVRWIFVFALFFIIMFSGGGVAFITKPLGAIYTALWIIWMSATMILRREGVRSEYDIKQRVVLIVSGIISIFVLLIAPPWEYVHFGGPIPRNGALAWIGITLFAAGVAISIWAMLELGKLFTVRLGVQPGHRVIKSGPYRFVRHPAYISYIISILGIGLSMGSIVALTTLMPIIVFIFWRMQEEERMLVAEFGEKYEVYMRETKRLIPFIY